jgi:hypothetical protein
MMGVHDVGIRQDPRQAWRYGMRWMTAQPAQDGQRAKAQPARLSVHAASPPEGDELTFDVAGQGSRQLERIALTPAE